jgi:hypothetical protein
VEHSAGAAAGSADATGDEEHGHSVDVSALGDAAVVATILAHSTRRRIEPAICDSRRNGLPKSQKVLLEIEDLFGALCVSFRLLSCRLVSCWTLMLCGTAVGCCPYLTLLAILPAAAAYVSVVQPPSMARASATLSDVLSCRNAAGLQPLHVAAWGESAVAALTGSGASSGSGASGGGRASLLRGGVWDGSWATVDIGADDAFDGGVICSPEGDASRRRAAVERQLRRAAAEAQARLDILTYLASLAGASTCLSR